MNSEKENNEPSKLELILALIIAVFVCIVLIVSFNIDTLKERLPIYQLIVPTLATGIGVATVINSSRSINIASKAINISIENQIRDKSAHLVINSYFQKGLPRIAPFIKQNENINGELYSLKTSYDRKKIEDIMYPRKYLNIASFYLEGDPNTIYPNFFSLETIDQELTVVNTGKGSALNIEYSFEFSNIDKFVGEELSVKKQKIYSHTSHPHRFISYDIKVSKELDESGETGFYIFSFRDNLDYVKDYMNIPKNLDMARKVSSTENQKNTRMKKLEIINETKSVEQIDSDQKIIKKQRSLKMKQPRIVDYIENIDSGKSSKIQLPMEFVILCRHYAICEFINNHYASSEDNLKSISPEGIIKLSYSDEHLIRSGEYSSVQKSFLTLSIKPKKLQVQSKSSGIKLYLEVTPII